MGPPKKREKRCPFEGPRVQTSDVSCSAAPYPSGCAPRSSQRISRRPADSALWSCRAVSSASGDSLARLGLSLVGLRVPGKWKNTYLATRHFLIKPKKGQLGPPDLRDKNLRGYLFFRTPILVGEPSQPEKGRGHRSLGDLVYIPTIAPCPSISVSLPHSGKLIAKNTYHHTPSLL